MQNLKKTISEYIKQYYKQFNSKSEEKKTKRKLCKFFVELEGQMYFLFLLISIHQGDKSIFYLIIHYDIRLIGDLRFTVQQFLESYISVGISDKRTSQKTGFMNAEYYKNTIRFAKPVQVLPTGLEFKFINEMMWSILISTCIVRQSQC